ncbi:hypothetical protein MUK42_07589 [Musa troglodytarum]|uniref:Uncharacterized protein n=1 Tax=Musa troglodytarum TaxID=320322 RepID=A0A9E7LET7_9LILI|nr:hypothetical protein MUK42_07589 [Musa troglodytarum]
MGLWGLGRCGDMERWSHPWELALDLIAMIMERQGERRALFGEVKLSEFSAYSHQDRIFLATAARNPDQDSTCRRRGADGSRTVRNRVQQKTARDLGEPLVPLLLLLLLLIPMSETLNHGAFSSRSQERSMCDQSVGGGRCRQLCETGEPPFH